MAKSAVRAGLSAAALILALPCAFPLSAQTFEQIDAIIDASGDEGSGLALAREQASRNEYLEALATLERVLAENPKSREARLMHAVYLCRIGDRQGGLVEIAQLKKKHYGKEVLAEARDRCERGEAR
ncbi:hypothetical protein [Erythrobacter sp. THAF29]|uniref:hypothetical protein n=1 Tax=Erythrobacter sp. THAF29 TaxID=2587851 RepID=UPI001267D0E8|nr:hypothetical protein [Erythrobacter sp. THAF29]QFT78494.1 hypothetical protein FIU90_13160 [Erythrobacter sp. THAF29]